jgi:probable HAF family extracellular repeat protein
MVLTSSTRAYIVQGETRTDIGSLGAGVIAANAINDSGQVVGISYLPNYLAHAFLWQDGNMIDLGALSDYSRSEAKAINKAGQIVGWSESDEGTRAFLWENGKMINLGTLGGNTSEARGINDNGQVVGFSRNSIGETHAFIWQDGRMTDLDPLNPTRPSMAYDINNQGQIVGSLGYIAAIWQYGTVDRLLPGGYYDFSDAYSINEHGQIVGHKGYQAVLWTVTSSFDQLKTLAALLAGADMPDAIARNLQDRLDRTIKFLEAGSNNAACGNLAGFINEVRGVSGKQMPADQADQILSSAQRVADALKCR